MKVGFAGSGNMAAAIARGLASSGAEVEMSFSDSGSGRAADLASELGGSAVPLADLAAGSELIVLAVKPAALDAAASELSGFSGKLVSVLGATPTDSVRTAFPDASVLRTMPNVAVEAGAGTICHVAPAGGDLDDVLELLGRIATLVELPEEELDAATSLMGCSPAWWALASDALIDAGVEAGLERGRARELVSLGASGFGHLMLRHEPAEIRRIVASPGGSTEAGLDALESNDAAGAYTAAVEASLARMRGEA